MEQEKSNFTPVQVEKFQRTESGNDFKIKQTSIQYTKQPLTTIATFVHSRKWVVNARHMEEKKHPCVSQKTDPIKTACTLSRMKK